MAYLNINAPRQAPGMVPDSCTERRGGPLGALRARFPQDPTMLCALHVLSSLIFVGSLILSRVQLDTLGLHIATYAHLTMPVLFVGLAIFPARLMPLPMVVFAVSFLAVEVHSIRVGPLASWTPLIMLVGLLVAVSSAVIGGLVTRRILRAYDQGNRVATPERAAFAGGVAMALTSTTLGGIVMWQDIYQHVHTVDLMTVIAAGAERSFQLGMFGTAAVLVFMNRPERKALPEIVLQVLAFGLLGMLHQYHLMMVTTLDAPLLALALLILRPIQTAIAGSLLGICVFIALTGFYADIPAGVLSHVQPLQTGLEVKLAVLTNALFVMMTAISLSRMHQVRVDCIRQQTLGRMTRAQELARFGYYLYDSQMRVVWLDPLAQKILSVGPSVTEDEFLLRINPEDRDDVSTAAAMAAETGRSFSFRFSTSGLWHPDCPQRHFTGFARYETGSAGQMVVYGIVVDVTQEHVKEEQLRLVLAELSERQGQQTQMFSMISHELRTPASIMSMLADELDEGGTWKDTGPQMRAVLDQLLSILSDMRQTVRPEQNLPIHIESFRPADLAAGVRDAFRSMATARGIEIHLQMGAGASELRETDRVRLNQTLSNLVKNAILHSQATQITVSYAEEPGHLGVWTVADNGRNIPQAQRDVLFHPFARSVDSPARVDGSGLGLYIAKGAIELLGGSIEYVERSLSGAVFRVTLPMKVPGDDPAAKPDRVPDRHVDLSGLKVLLVEDSDTMGSLLEARLTKLFGEVKWLRDGASGLAWISLNNPDVVISDLFMPGLGGDEMTRKLRQRGYDKPIIGMTATDIGEEVERFRKSGANAVITKPLRPQDIQAALAELL